MFLGLRFILNRSRRAGVTRGAAAILAAFLVTGCAGMTKVKAEEVSATDAVLLLPGLARTPRSMRKLKARLEQEGYQVVTLNYPSTKLPVEALADEYLAPAIERLQASGVRRIHFVAHSLGAIVLRYHYAHHTLPARGRVVLLGPPSRGSEVVDRLGRFPPFRWVNGPAGLQLGTGPDALPQTLPDLQGEVAVVAGARSINLVLSALIPGRDDGKVSVERTRMPGMGAFAEVPVAHPFLMSAPKVIDMVVSYLATGTLSPR